MSGTDEATVSYFDNHCHEYGRDRIRGLAKVLRPMLGEGTRLVDVGSGTGANLARLSKALRVTDLTALDAAGPLGVARGRAPAPGSNRMRVDPGRGCPGAA